MDVPKHTNWKKFSKFIINLRDKPERLSHTLSQLDKVDLSNLVTVCYGEKPDLNLKNNLYKYITEKAYDNIKNIQSTLLIPNLKSVAVTNSHKKIWEYLVNNNLKHAIIMEDDIEITDAFLLNKQLNYLLDLINNVPNNIPKYVIFNGRYIDNGSDSSNIFNDNVYYHDEFNNIINYASYNSKAYPNFKYFPSTLGTSIDICGSHFYYLNLEMAKILLNELRITSYQLDVEISRLSKKQNIKDRCSFLNVETDSIIQSGKFESSVQPFIMNNHTLSSVLNLPNDITEHILQYFPLCLVKN